MTTQYITIAGIRLAYVETNPGAGQAIFLIHGNSSSMSTWTAQMTDPALRGFRLLAFDLPAHGASDAADAVTNGYSLPGIGALMAKAVMALSGAAPYILAGVSLGTNIIAEMLPHGVRPSGLVLIGPCILGEDQPINKAMKPDTCIQLSFVDDLSDADVVALKELIAHHADHMVEKDLRRVKDNFRSKLGQTVASGSVSDEVALIRERRIPTLIVFGEEDLAFHTHYLDDAGLGEVVQLAGAGHWAHLDEPQAVSALLAAFAENVVK